MASGFRAKGGGGGGGGGVLAGDVTGPLLANTIAPGAVTSPKIAPNTITQGNLASDAMPAWNVLTNPGFNWIQLYDPTIANIIPDNTVGPDGWKLTRENANVTYQRVSTAGIPGWEAANLGRVTKTVGAGKMMMYQPLESLISRGLQQTIVFSIKLNMPLAKQMRIGYFIYTGATPNQVVPAPVAAWNGFGVAPTLNGGFAYVGSFSFGAPAGFSNWDVVFTPPALGANDTLCAFIVTDEAFAAGNSFDISETDLAPGSGGHFLWYPLDEFDDIGRCRRFIEKSYDLNTLAGTITTNGRVNEVISPLTVGFSSGGVRHVPKVRVPVLAEVTLYSPTTGAVGNWLDATTAADYAVGAVAFGESGFSVIGGAVAGETAQGHFLVNTSL